ncbi:hypothetical protein DZF79_04225 [Vibrio parahaemolyticus]|nr:hypothetical protein [Vibrio parahaemolyticus]
MCCAIEYFITTIAFILVPFVLIIIGISSVLMTAMWANYVTRRVLTINVRIFILKLFLSFLISQATATRANTLILVIQIKVTNNLISRFFALSAK